MIYFYKIEYHCYFKSYFLEKILLLMANLLIKSYIYVSIQKCTMRYFWLFSLLFFLSDTYAQQKPQFSQFMLNKYYENPAYGGMERSLSIFATYRDQFSEFVGHPSTFYCGADMPFYIWNGAIGFSLYNQKTGLLSHTNLKISYNHVVNTQMGFLSFGGRIGLDNVSINGNGIITPDGDYTGGINHNDPNLDISPYKGYGLCWEIGTYFYGNHIESGIVISELPSHAFSLGDGRYNKSWSSSGFFQYKYSWSENLQILPSVLLKADQAVLQVDAGVLTRINNNLVLGSTIRGYGSTSLDALSFIVGTNIGKKYNISYSYDFGLSKLRSVHQGSHEIMLSYNLQKLIGIGLPPKIIYNPRDL